MMSNSFFKLKMVNPVYVHGFLNISLSDTYYQDIPEQYIKDTNSGKAILILNIIM